MEVEIIKELNPEQFYLVFSLEKKIKEFEEVNLSELTKQLHAIDQQRQLVISNINQVQGAITSGRIIIGEELEKAGVKFETYVEQKAAFLKEKEKQNEANETASNDADRGNAG